MKITIFINFAENILKNPIAITLDDSETLATLNEIRMNEHKTPYNRVYNSSAAMPLQYQHKNRVFTSSDFTKSLHELGLQDNDSIDLSISNINYKVMRNALTADLLATNVDDPRSHSTPLSIGLIAQRQLSKNPWTAKEIVALQNNLAKISGDRPGDYPQLLLQYAMLNLLRLQAPAQDPSLYFNSEEISILGDDTIDDSKLNFAKIECMMSQQTILELSSNMEFKEGCLLQLAKALQNNKTIVKFALVHSDSNPNQNAVLKVRIVRREKNFLAQLAKALCNNKTQTPEEKFAEKLADIQAVKEFYKQDGVVMDREVVKELAEALRRNTTLEIFHLDNLKIENGGISSLATELKNNKTLLTLRITNIEISIADTEALADLLRTNTTLRSVVLDLDDIPVKNKESLIAAAENSTTLENFTLDGVQIFGKNSLQRTYRKEHTTHCMLSILDRDFKNLTDATIRSGYLDFQLVNLTSVGEIIIGLELYPKVLIELIKEYLQGDITLTPLPLQRKNSGNFLMTKEILAKTPSLADLTKDIIRDIEEKENSVVISFTKNTERDRKLLFRNALMNLFKEKQMNDAIADVNSITGALTISKVPIETLEELNIIPKSYNNRCIIA